MSAPDGAAFRLPPGHPGEEHHARTGRKFKLASVLGAKPQATRRDSGAPKRPVALRVTFEDIPAELQARGQWVLWRYAYAAKAEKWTKPPFQRNGEKASSTDPKTWCAFAGVRDAYRAGGWDGIGFVHLPEDEITAGDGDHCRDPQTGATTGDDAAALLELNTYTEASPSATGIRTFAFGKKPGRNCKKGDFELYDGLTREGKPGGRFLTVTGHRLGSAPATINRRQAEIERIYWRYWPKRDRGTAATSSSTAAPLFLSDEELLHRAFDCGKNGAKVRALYSGDWAGFKSQSEAEQSLCNYLAFWFRKDAGAIDRVFRASGLMREKWDRGDYRERTIRNAIGSVAGGGFAPEQPRVKPFSSSNAKSASMPHQSGSSTGGVEPIAVESLAALRPKPVMYLVPDIIPSGMLGMMVGEGGGGKTMTVLETAAAVSAGRCAFGLDYPNPPKGKSLLIQCEDDWERTTIPRLVALGADLAGILRIRGVNMTPDGKSLDFHLGHFDQLKKLLVANSDILFISIDPAGAYVGKAGVNEHKDADLRAVLGPLSETANQSGAAIMLVKHLNKTANVSAVQRVSGSTGYVNACRYVYMIAADPDDPERRLMLPIKANILKAGGMGLAFRMAPLDPAEARVVLTQRWADLPADDLEGLSKQLFRQTWEHNVTADANAVAGGGGGGKKDDKNKVARCADFIREFLREYAYPSDEIVKAAKTKGFTFDNVGKAKAQLKDDDGLRNWNRGTFQGVWWSGFGDPGQWKLRPESPPSSGPQPPDSPRSPDSPHTVNRGGGKSRAGGQSPETAESQESQETRGGLFNADDEREVAA